MSSTMTPRKANKVLEVAEKRLSTFRKVVEFWEKIRPDISSEGCIELGPVVESEIYQFLKLDRNEITEAIETMQAFVNSLNATLGDQ